MALGLQDKSGELGLNFHSIYVERHPLDWELLVLGSGSQMEP